MAEHNSFETELSNLGFSLQDGETICNHNKSYYFYYQDCACCNQPYQGPKKQLLSKELTWFKEHLCVDCLDGHTKSLFHGGHYENSRIFFIMSNTEIRYHDGLLVQKELNSDEIAFEIDHEELQSYYIH